MIKTSNNNNIDKNAPLIKVAITQGDPNGIGIEVILKTFADEMMFDLCIPILYGNEQVINYHRKNIQSNIHFHLIDTAKEAKRGCLNLVNCCNTNFSVNFGKQDPDAGHIAYMALERATDEILKGAADVLVTAPINKASIQSSNFHFPGHTEYLEERLGSKHGALMILENTQMRIALTTTHCPVSEIATLLTPERLELQLRLLQYSLCHDFLVPMPRIAVLSLNPHCGDKGTLGKEEKEIIDPIIQKVVSEGKHVYGPYSADGFFGTAMYKHFDGVLAMYHDQGLAPFKALSMEDGVNFTAGLNYIRTSPDHGTAFDIAGKNMASPNSMRAAIFQALDIYRQRKTDEAAGAEPLPKLYQERHEHHGGHGKGRH